YPSPNVVLMRGSKVAVTPWGSQIGGSNNNYLDIESRYQDFLPVPLGEENDPAFVGQLGKYPGVFFIRCGKAIVACTDGWIIQYAFDDR
ncbi:MAG TPA: hypothetical protein VL992_20305, partial [Tepidisphaeraceae bacterium]|nr:hypothetical protein [Tepidisphaeraceae bacterium]